VEAAEKGFSGNGGMDWEEKKTSTSPPPKQAEMVGGRGESGFYRSSASILTGAAISGEEGVAGQDRVVILTHKTWNVWL